MKFSFGCMYFTSINIHQMYSCGPPVVGIALIFHTVFRLLEINISSIFYRLKAIVYSASDL